jgi:putative lipoprotein
VNSAFKAAAAAILILVFVSSAAAGGPDPWFAKDKYEHFAFSAFTTMGTAKILHRHFEMNKNKSLAFGIGFTISLGAAKEGIDSRSKKGVASIKDFIWDIAGVVVGASAAGLLL